MINVNQAYRQACESNERKSYVIAKFGLYDKNAKGKISNVVSASQSFSNVNKTYNEIRETNYNYISNEPNRVKLDGTFYFINNQSQPNSSENLAYWSSYMSDSLGTFTTNPTITYIFSSQINYTDLTLYFQEVCKEFKVYYYLNDEIFETKHITNNAQLNVETTTSQTYSLQYFDKLVIEFIKTNIPYRCIKFNEIDFGVYDVFTEKQIVDYDIIDEMSIDSSELSSNSLNLSIDNSNGNYDILNPNNKLNLLQEKQEISLYHNLKVGNIYKEIPLGTFLLKNFQIGNQVLDIECYDDIYFMNKIYYGSKFYNNVEVTIILEDLFSYFNYTKYIIDDELQGITLSGYLSNKEFRECLRLIAEASGCVVNKNRYGVTYIFKTYDESIKTFERKELFNENPSKNLFNNVIDINEYDYSSQTQNVEIYNATLGIGTHTLIYNQYPILESTLVKSETNSNYSIIGAYATTCIVNVTNETNVKLKATLINENKSIKRIKKNNNIIVDEYAITKIDNSLITNSNINTIATWKLNKSEIKFTFDILVTPYIEVGDTCKYKTKFNQTKTFVPTRMEFTKSLLQNVEGE